MDELLSMVENPTRRRILEALAREPHYPLQLSKELGVSQPAVVKHLNLLEDRGMVSKYRQDSDIGPKRTVYLLKSEFTLLLDIRNGMFNARLVFPEEEDAEVDGIEGLEETRSSISEIDRRMAELERIRNGMVRRRESLIRTAMSLSDSMDYRHRNLLYGLLNDPEKDIESISMEMSMNVEQAKRMVREIEEILGTEVG